MRGCNENVTVWNRYRDSVSGKDVFVRHVLPVLCRWKSSTRRSEQRSEAMKAVSAAVSLNLVVIVPHSEYYRPYAEWLNMSDAGKKKFFTLNISDLIALGARKIEITGEEPYTEAGVRKLLGQNGAVIAAFTDNTDVLAGSNEQLGAHFRVGCFYGFQSWRG